MLMKKASGGDSPLRQGAGKSFWTLPISHRRWRGLQYVFWRSVWALRDFTMKRKNRRKGDVRRWTRWSHHLVARPRAGPRPPMVSSTRTTSDDAPLPIKTPRREKPKTPCSAPPFAKRQNSCVMCHSLDQ